MDERIGMKYQSRTKDRFNGRITLEHWISAEDDDFIIYETKHNEDARIYIYEGFFLFFIFYF